jgi:hypothetical protein
MCNILTSGGVLFFMAFANFGANAANPNVPSLVALCDNGRRRRPLGSEARPCD